jgi:hypothetical protein
MTEEKKVHEENTTVEKLESVGQIIIGEMEKIGGILTADPISQAEGELAEDAGSVRYETADAMDEDDENVKKNRPTE